MSTTARSRSWTPGGRCSSMPSSSPRSADTCSANCRACCRWATTREACPRRRTSSRAGGATCPRICATCSGEAKGRVEQGLLRRWLEEPVPPGASRLAPSGDQSPGATVVRAERCLRRRSGPAVLRPEPLGDHLGDLGPAGPVPEPPDVPADRLGQAQPALDGSSRGRSGLVRPGPVEREMLAGAARPAPLEAESLHLVLLGRRPGRHLSRTDLGAWSVMNLHARPLLGRRRPGQRHRAASRLARHLDPPAAKVVCDLELDRRVFDATNLVDHRGEPRRPPAGVAAEDCLDRLSLTLVGTLVDEEPHGGLGLPGPDVSLEGPDRHDVEPVEAHIPVIPRANMPRQDAVALPLVGRLRECASAWDAASADVEPVAGDTPGWDLGHRSSSVVVCAVDPLTAPAKKSTLRTSRPWGAYSNSAGPRSRPSRSAIRAWPIGRRWRPSRTRRPPRRGETTCEARAWTLPAWRTARSEERRVGKE